MAAWGSQWRFIDGEMGNPAMSRHWGWGKATFLLLTSSWAPTHTQVFWTWYKNFLASCRWAPPSPRSEVWLSQSPNRITARQWRNELRLHRLLLVIRWLHSELEKSVSSVFYSWISKDPLRGWPANRAVQMCPLTHCLVRMSPQDHVGDAWLEYTAAGCSDLGVFSWASTCLWLLEPQNLEMGFLTPWGPGVPLQGIMPWIFLGVISYLALLPIPWELGQCVIFPKRMILESHKGTRFRPQL